MTDRQFTAYPIHIENKLTRALQWERAKMTKNEIYNGRACTQICFWFWYANGTFAYYTIAGILFPNVFVLEGEKIDIKRCGNKLTVLLCADRLEADSILFSHMSYCALSAHFA